MSERAHHRSPVPNRRLRLAAVAGAVPVVVVVVVVVLVLQTTGGSPKSSVGSGRTTAPPPPSHRSTTTSTSRSTSTSGTSTTAAGSSAASSTIGSHPVGTTTLDLTEPPSTPGGPARPLPTQVWYPAVGSGPAATPARHGAPYPLLVFSQGYALPVSAYVGLLQDWASAGYVVAAPTYPFTDPNAPTGLDETDVVNHPADLRFVITQVLQASAGGGSPLSGMIDAGRIGLAGHSDGGNVSLAVADNSCCRDPRIKALAILSGAEQTYFGGAYFTGPSVPMLVVQGSADTVNNPPCSAQIYDGDNGTKYYLDLLGDEHVPAYVTPGDPTYENVAARVTTDFFDAELAGQRQALGDMEAASNVPGVAQLSIGGSAPPVEGSCPGAPGQ